METATSAGRRQPVVDAETALRFLAAARAVLARSLEMLDGLLADNTPESIEKSRRIVASCISLNSVDRIACERIRSIIKGLKSFSRAHSHGIVLGGDQPKLAGARRGETQPCTHRLKSAFLSPLASD